MAQSKAEISEHELKGLDIQLCEYQKFHRLKIKAKDSLIYSWTKSVTTITGVLDKPFLPNWYAGKVVEAAKALVLPGMNAEEIEGALVLARGAGDLARDHAALIGTQAHEMIRAQAEGEFSTLDIASMEPEAVEAFKTFLNWSGEHKMEPVLSEQPVGSLRFDYAGILDTVSVVEWEGKKVKALIDFSTGKSVWPSKYAQLGGYLQAYRESFQDETIEMCFILNFRGDGSPMAVYPFTLAEMEDSISFFGNLRRAKAMLDDATKLLKIKGEANE